MLVRGAPGATAAPATTTVAVGRVSAAALKGRSRAHFLCRERGAPA